ncbi:MAG: hypothetical protein ABL974_05290 [Prosthecobacter sp.]
MKGILVLILAAAVGYISYQYAYPILAGYVKFEKHKKEIVVAPAPKPVIKKEVAVVAPPKPVVEAPKTAPVMEAPKPAVVMEAPKPAVDPNAFVAPPLPTIEETTKNWTVLPKSAFPRQVTIKRDLQLSMKIGNSKAATQVKAGGKMYAVGQDGTNILVSPSDTSPMRGAVAFEDTDLKDVLIQGYERWKITYVETLKKAHEFRLVAAERAKNAPVQSSGTAKAGNDKPAKDKDGTYPLLVASMKSGQVTEIKPDIVKEWGEPQLTEGVWTVIVKYETQTMFGKFDTEAQAHIKNGAVEKWIYTGSGEVVP